MNKEKMYAFMLAVIALCQGTAFAFTDEKEKPAHMSEIKPERISLPDPSYESDISVEESLLKRRSIRNFKDRPMTLVEISQLLWAAQGVTSSRGFRTAPSAGALYPLEVYVAAGDVDGLQDGVYHYNPARHELVTVALGDKRTDLCNAALGQSSVRKAAAVIVFAAVYERTSVKYGDRAVQYVHMETGHAAQNVFLQSVSLDLGTVVIGAFHDNAVKEVMKMSYEERPLYIMPVGKIK